MLNRNKLTLLSLAAAVMFAGTSNVTFASGANPTDKKTPELSAEQKTQKLIEASNASFTKKVDDLWNKTEGKSLSEAVTKSASSGGDYFKAVAAINLAGGAGAVIVSSNSAANLEAAKAIEAKLIAAAATTGGTEITKVAAVQALLNYQAALNAYKIALKDYDTLIQRKEECDALDTGKKLKMIESAQSSFGSNIKDIEALIAEAAAPTMDKACEEYLKTNSRNLVALNASEWNSVPAAALFQDNSRYVQENLMPQLFRGSNKDIIVLADKMSAESGKFPKLTLVELLNKLSQDEKGAKGRSDLMVGLIQSTLFDDEVTTANLVSDNSANFIDQSLAKTSKTLAIATKGLSTEPWVRVDANSSVLSATKDAKITNNSYNVSAGVLVGLTDTDVIGISGHYSKGKVDNQSIANHALLKVIATEDEIKKFSTAYADSAMVDVSAKINVSEDIDLNLYVGVGATSFSPSADSEAVKSFKEANEATVKAAKEEQTKELALITATDPSKKAAADKVANAEKDQVKDLNRYILALQAELRQTIDFKNDVILSPVVSLGLNAVNKKSDSLFDTDYINIFKARDEVKGAKLLQPNLKVGFDLESNTDSFVPGMNFGSMISLRNVAKMDMREGVDAKFKMDTNVGLSFSVSSKDQVFNVGLGSDLTFNTLDLFSTGLTNTNGFLAVKVSL